MNLNKGQRFMKSQIIFLLLFPSLVSVQVFAEEANMILGNYMHFPIGEKFFHYKTNPPLVLAEEVQNRCWFTATFVNQEGPGTGVYQFPLDMAWPGANQNSTFFVIKYETSDMRDNKTFEKIMPQYSDESMVLTFEIPNGISQLLINSTDYFEPDNATVRRCFPLFDDPPRSLDYYDSILPLKIQKSYAESFGFPLDVIMCKNNLELITKIDESLACVSSETKNKLIQRGWAKSDLDLI